MLISGSRRNWLFIALLLTLISAIISSANAQTLRQPPDGMVLIPAGEFIMGSDDKPVSIA